MNRSTPQGETQRPLGVTLAAAFLVWQGATALWALVTVLRFSGMVSFDGLLPAYGVGGFLACLALAAAVLLFILHKMGWQLALAYLIASTVLTCYYMARFGGWSEPSFAWVVLFVKAALVVYLLRPETRALFDGPEVKPVGPG